MKKLVLLFFVLFACCAFAVSTDNNYLIIHDEVIGSGKSVYDSNYFVHASVGEVATEENISDTNYSISVGFIARVLGVVSEEAAAPPTTPSTGGHGRGSCITDVDCLGGICLDNKCFFLMDEVEFIPKERSLSVFPSQAVILPEFSVRNLSRSHFVFNVSFECPSMDSSCVKGWCEASQSEKSFNLKAMDSFTFKSVRCSIPDVIEATDFYSRMVLTEASSGRKAVFPITFFVVPREEIMVTGFVPLESAVGLIKPVLGFGLVCFGNGQPYCLVRFGEEAINIFGLEASSFNIAMLLLLIALAVAIRTKGSKPSLVFAAIAVLLFLLWLFA